MKISVCMGTRNEEAAIGKVISDIRKHLGPETEIVITDGSSDRTAEIAEELGAKVIRQEPQGYGIALKEALLNASGDIILTTDCDDTYPMEKAPEMVALLQKGYAVVSGSRLKGKGRVEAMSPLNEYGNRMFAALTSLLYGFECTDASTGFRAYRREVIQGIEWTENTGLSLELLFKPAALKYRVTELPIEYRDRRGETKLSPWKGGAQMLKSILKYKIVPIRNVSKIETKDF